MSKESRVKIREDGTLPGCIGTGKPIPPNNCDTCRQHSDFTCHDLGIDVKNERPKRK